MRVLLCLLSRQHVPNLLSVHHYKPDQLVLIESQGMKRSRAADSFLEALRFGGLDYSRRCHVEPLDAEDDLDAIRYALQSVHDRFQSSGVEWIANLTGGTKPMSIAAYEFFKGRGKPIYTNAARPGHFLNLGGGSAEDESAHHLSIREFLAGYGFALTKPADKVTEAEQQAREWAPSARLLALHDQGAGVLNLSDDERKTARRRGITLEASRFRLPCDELRAKWLGDAETRRLDRHEAEFLTGGWLEVFFWDLLARHAEAIGIRDVRLGLTVKSLDSRAENELDVAFMHNHGLSMIECKTGFQNNPQAVDALYKVEAVIGRFGANLVRSYLASTAGSILNERGEVNDGLRSRAALYNCRILPRDQIRELAAHADDAEKVRAIMFSRHRGDEGRT